jgi:hypothetical protein
MVLFIKILTIIAIGWCIGFTNAMLTRWLDSALDYGKVFGKFRYDLVRRYAEAAGIVIQFDEMAKTAMLQPVFSDRLNGLNEVYWQVAKFAPGVQKFICRPCMSVWIFLATIIPYGFAMLDNGLCFLMLPIYIVAFSCNEWYINK